MKASHTVIDPELLRGGASKAVGALKVLGNEDRLLLLCQLSQGEMCVSDLQERLGLHQPTLSQHSRYPQKAAEGEVVAHSSTPSRRARHQRYAEAGPGFDDKRNDNG
jgi:DNA-binding transcriptional ArsR family regulator